MIENLEIDHLHEYLSINDRIETIHHTFIVQRTKHPHDVANSDTPRLPTLKELIGYQTYDYTTPSSIFLNLLPTIDRNEVHDLQNIENDQIKVNVGTIKTKYLKENINEPIDKTNESYLNHELANIFEEHDTENNDIDNKSSTGKKRKTRIDHAGSSTTTLKPTTMRGTPIISSTSKTITRGFYVTKGDIETTTIMHPTEILMDNINSNIINNETIVSTKVENISMTDLFKDNETKGITTFADTDKEYSEYSNIITKLERTTPLTMTENIIQKVKINDQTLFVVNNISSDTSRREKVKYSDVSTSLYRSQESLITDTTVPNILGTEIDKNSEIKTTSIDYTLPVESVNTESDITMLETITSTINTLNTSEFANEDSPKENIIQLENFLTTTSNIPSAKIINDQSNIDEFVSGKPEEFESTMIFDHILEHETTTIKSILTTSNFERSLEGITSNKETDKIKSTNVETTTNIAENKNAILDDFDTATTREELKDTNINDKNAYESNPNVQQATTLSESTKVPSTTLSNLLPTQIPLTIQSRQEEDVHPRRQRPTIIALNNQFGQRRRTNLDRRVTQKYEIEDQPSIRKDSNGPKRVLVYRKRQRRPNNTSHTTVANNTVSNGEVKTEVTENKNRRSKLVVKKLKINRKEHVEEDSVPLEKTNTFQDSPLVTEYTERPVDEGTLSKSTGSSSSRTPGTILANRIRKPNTSSQSSFLPTSKHPSTTVLLGDNRKSRPSDETTLSPTTTIVDAFDDATVKPELSIKDEDERAEISDQNGRAQELAVTLAEPPTSQSSSSTGRLPLRDTLRRRISTTVAPRTDSPRTSSTSLRFSTVPKTRQKVTTTMTTRTTTRTRKDGTSRSSTSRPRRPPVIDYDYYEDEDTPIVEKAMYNGKLFLTSNGTIRCLDQGNFPHPSSCKKFITCAKMVNGLIIGAEYTCPDKLSFDPVGGICNWSAGLGCKE
ncbi:mucin-5AC-like isoform X3 [Vespula squamosa]|uniref:Mucin-5AC-like isoform X3 n=1 Tax=Vespula squamosa TaxID=30214 RepID=A0ABD2A437_VESSQ